MLQKHYYLYSFVFWPHLRSYFVFHSTPVHNTSSLITNECRLGKKITRNFSLARYRLVHLPREPWCSSCWCPDILWWCMWLPNEWSTTSIMAPLTSVSPTLIDFVIVLHAVDNRTISDIIVLCYDIMKSGRVKLWF